MATLTIGSLVWHTFSHEGKTAYQYNRHVIISKDGAYHLIYCGKTILASPSMGKLLEEATPVILDHYASEIVPVWQAPSTYKAEPGCDLCGWADDHSDHCPKTWR